jgi:hypothetical protein
MYSACNRSRCALAVLLHVVAISSLASVRPKIAFVRVFVVLRGVAVAEDGG